jgi:hypothetical protein
MKKVFWCIVTGAILVALAGCGTGLIAAAKKGDVATMQRLLDKGADINESAIGDGTMTGGTPLFYAVYNCHVEAVRYLIQKGADVEAVGFSRGGFFSGRPLHIAVEGNCFESVQILLDAGADIDAKSNNHSIGSALAIAARNGNVKTVKYLISRGADVDVALTDLQEPKAVALLEKYSQSIATAEATPSKAPVSPMIRSDVDTIPYLKASPRPDAFAVVIGIETYQTLPKSDYSKSDALTVKAYLAALGFQERNIELMVDQQATRSAVEKTLEAWLPNQVTNQSTVFVYFSGHGAPEPASGEAYLVPYDGDPNYLGVTGYSLKRLYGSLGKLEVKEIIVVLDSCFSGSGGRSVLAKGSRPLVMMAPTGVLSSNMAVLTATQGSQISTSSPEKGHGVFTYYFLQAIKEGRTDIAEIYETIKPQVEDDAKQLNVQQSPSLNPGADKIKGRFSLRR